MAKQGEEVTEAADTVEDIVAALKRVDVGVQKIRNAGVSDELLIIMINDATGGRTHGVGHKQIRKVLDALPTLRERYLKEKK